MEAPPQVDPMPFYEACVQDSCSCDTGGDCECFCSAVASYAQQCTKEGACVFWRTPDLCRECPPALAPRPPRGGVGAAEMRLADFPCAISMLRIHLSVM